jgi:DNA-directed RNA polymerase specialized sigma24 family protein
MAHPNAVLHYVRRLTVSACPYLTDRELLERFARDRDEAAFTELVRRHGQVVFGVCRRALGREHDAEEAFQATFLALARRADAVRWRDSAAGWLQAVALNACRRLRRTSMPGNLAPEQAGRVR